MRTIYEGQWDRLTVPHINNLKMEVNKMNLRQAITRNVTYTKVTLHYEDDEMNYVVYGRTTPTKEMKALIKKYPHIKKLPSIDTDIITELRAISIENFINNSELITKEKEKLNSEFGKENINNESEEK
jgi:hypothetical protein